MVVLHHRPKFFMRRLRPAAACLDHARFPNKAFGLSLSLCLSATPELFLFLTGRVQPPGSAPVLGAAGRVLVRSGQIFQI